MHARDTMNKSVKTHQKYRKIGGLVPTVQPEPDFTWTCIFCEMLGNVELIMYMKFQKNLMTGGRDMDKIIKNTPKMFSPHLYPQNIFFQKIGQYHFSTLIML